ncbi:MFS transporter [Nocardiopsis sp. CNT-189]
MKQSTGTTGAPASARSGRRGGSPAVWTVALGIFTLMTCELLPVGLLTPVGSELGVAPGTAGLMVTVPGLVAAVSAPAVSVAGGRFDRRVILAVLIGGTAAANLVCALAPHFAVLLGARIAVGVAIGGFWALGGSLATRLVPAEKVPRATAIVFGGVSVASVAGVPAGTLLGDLAGWRASFAALAVLGALATVLLVALLPALPPERPVDVTTLGRLLTTDPAVRTGVAVTLLLIGGHYAAFTFARPLLGGFSGLQAEHIGPALFGFGAAGIAANFVLGPRTAQAPKTSLVLIAGALAAVLALFALLGGAAPAGAVLMLGWGLAYGAVSVALQNWMLAGAPEAAEAATALMVCAFNLAIALGALAGGAVLNASAEPAVLWCGAVLALAAAAAMAAARRPGTAP